MDVYLLVNFNWQPIQLADRVASQQQEPFQERKGTCKPQGHCITHVDILVLGEPTCSRCILQKKHLHETMEIKGAAV